MPLSPVSSLGQVKLQQPVPDQVYDSYLPMIIGRSLPSTDWEDSAISTCPTRGLGQASAMDAPQHR